jgi:pSer/pThr/pTyr-binding forkhead associated (FHA) protein
LGSRNGTFLNGKRLSAAKQESEVTKIVHGTILQVGCTKLLCHIHIGHETCDNCEPGLLLANPVVEDNFVSLKTRHQSELRRLKSKFGIEQDNTDTACRIALGYYDRAQSRREHIGSSSDHFKIQQSSLNE